MYAIRCICGSEVPIDLSLATWRNGADVFFTAIIRDVSERKQTEEEVLRSLTALKLSEKTLEETVRELPGHRRYQDYSWKIRALIKPCASRRAWA